MSLFDISILFRPTIASADPTETVFLHAATAINAMRPRHEKLGEWFLKGDTLDQAHLYPFLDGQGQPTSVARAVFNARNVRNETSGRVLGLWNGEPRELAASMSYLHKGSQAEVDLMNISLKSALLPTSSDEVIATIADLARHFDARLISNVSHDYDPVFPDRPGVGWMLYLPGTLTARQVPEAQALVPVLGTDPRGKPLRIGTVLVSVTDGPFSDRNPEHVKTANAIELRLVDQDLLPRYADL